MSEYQYHEWQAVDRVLTYEDQAAVNEFPAISISAPARPWSPTIGALRRNLANAVGVAH